MCAISSLILRIRGFVLDVNCCTAKHFRFPEGEPANMGGFPEAFTTGEGVGVDEMEKALVAQSGVDPSLVSRLWVENHYRWIVWKLAHMETAFPEQLAGRYLTAKRVLDQLRYRYEREINNAQRSALKKVLERDESSSRYMILCVAAITSLGGIEGKFKQLIGLS